MECYLGGFSIRDRVIGGSGRTSRLLSLSLVAVRPASLSGIPCSRPQKRSSAQHMPRRPVRDNKGQGFTLSSHLPSRWRKLERARIDRSPKLLYTQFSLGGNPTMPDLQLYPLGHWKLAATANRWTDPPPSSPGPCWPVQPCTKASKPAALSPRRCGISIAIMVGHSSTMAWSNALHL